MASENQLRRGQEKPVENTSKNKKPYSKPAFRYEKVFETLALSCGKVTSGGFPNCQLSRKS